MYLPLFMNLSSKIALNQHISPDSNFYAKFIFCDSDQIEDTITNDVLNTDAAGSLSGFNNLVQNGRYPKVLSILGPFQELDEKLENAINLNFTNKILISLIPDLFIGSIIQTKKFALMITSCEVYARDANVDEHLDRDESNFPHVINSRTRRYKRVIIKIVPRSDGGAIINKLQIGTTLFDLLVTGSLLLYPQHTSTVSVGPSCNPYIINENMKMASILFAEDRIKTYMINNDNISSLTPKTPNIEGVRQLTTLFQHPSTYLNYRSHLLESRLTHLATIFTLSKYPTRGYGMSITNRSRLLSEFFAICCECILFNNSVITEDLLLPLKNKVENQKNQETSNTLLELLKSLYDYIQECNNNKTSCDILVFFITIEKFSTVSQTVSSQISATNKKVQVPLEAELYKIFGSNDDD